MLKLLQGFVRSSFHFNFSTTEQIFRTSSKLGKNIIVAAEKYSFIGWRHQKSDSQCHKILNGGWLLDWLHCFPARNMLVSVGHSSISGCFFFRLCTFPLKIAKNSIKTIEGPNAKFSKKDQLSQRTKHTGYQSSWKVTSINWCSEYLNCRTHLIIVINIAQCVLLL